MEMLDRFAAVVRAGSEHLSRLSDAEAALHPQPGKWSKKEELGHLVDSVINNYARIIRVQREDEPALPEYQQDFWVERQGYRERDWKQLLALWSALNAHMLAAAQRIPPAALARRCSIGGGPPITLGFVIEDYVDHMVHHLVHLGAEVRKFRRAESAYA